MKFGTIASLTALGASSVSALGDLGFNLGVKNNDGTCKSTEDYAKDLKALSAYTSTVKVYAASDCNTLQNLGPAAEKAGFGVFVGVWPNDDAHFSAEKQALQSYLPNIKSSTVKGILVGSCLLYTSRCV